MIQRMSKYSFLVYHQEYEEFLLALRSLGVVHITERNNPREAESLRALMERRAEIASLERALTTLLPAAEVLELEALPSISEDEGEAELTALSEAFAAREALLQAQQHKRAEILEQEPWGDFDPAQLARLSEAGYHLAFYAISASALTEEYREAWQALPIARSGAQALFVRLERPGDEPAPEAEAIKAPTKSLSRLREELASLEHELAQATEALIASAPLRRARLQAYDHLLSSGYTLGAARLQAVREADDKLMLLEGWVPEVDAPRMQQGLDAAGYYYQQMEITDEDRVPIKLRNNAFTRLFESITQMFSLPNYGEIDQTALLAPFFLLFFGLCFGDGGYGLLLFVVATIFKIKRKGEDNSLLSLLQWLGGGAFVIGMLMGTFFGVTLGYAKAEDYFMGQDNMMMISVVIGLIQILFAKGVAAYKTKVQRGWAHALAPIAWLVVLIGGALVLALPKISLALPRAVEYVLYALVGLSLLVVFFYNTPGKNPLVNLGSGLWTTYNVASGLLGDTLSYIRLFAIGLTGGILGSVFNQLAIEQTAGLPIFVQVPLMVLILTLGHGLNIGLAMISSFVHPLRLTFVEYYKNSEFEGGGKAYTPFKEN